MSIVKEKKPTPTLDDKSLHGFVLIEYNELKQITARLDYLTEQVTILVKSTTVKSIRTIDDIALKLDYSKDYILKHPWLMPLFGRSEYGKRTKKWTAKTFDDWYLLSIEDRKKQWELMSTAEKQKCIGIKDHNPSV